MLRPPAGPAVAAQIPLETRMTGSQRPDETSPGTTLLAATGICKHFGDFTANDDVGFEIEAGEIHALLGDGAPDTRQKVDRDGADDIVDLELVQKPVSYTHLTLPTILRV